MNRSVGPQLNENCQTIEVPYGCPLPAICPVCNAPSSEVYVTEVTDPGGLLVVVRVLVPVGYCASHRVALRKNVWMHNSCVAGALFFGVFGFIGLAFPVMSYPCFAASAVMTYYSFKSRKRMNAARGLKISTLGSHPAFCIRTSNRVWADALRLVIASSRR